MVNTDFWSGQTIDGRACALTRTRAADFQGWMAINRARTGKITRLKPEELRLRDYAPHSRTHKKLDPETP
ncbi:hypothetical protein D1222_01915 [Henriciella algicola]|uniref:Uncharacterized protein n=1 Tax=Henriciella algicola TaxID=1608422 RepID=A0A399RMG2_9PROT|nr:hypothetical protein D1222_01915 [Henriciella algicola]